MITNENLALAKSVVKLCAQEDLNIATAESCTGGLVAAALTHESGASNVFERGFVTYSNDAKIEMLGVTPMTIRESGAVSKETAMEMAHGALARSEASIVVAITGIAGPDGGTAQKPVGLVHFAVKHFSGAMIHRDINLGDIGREKIRQEAVHNALQLLKKIVQDHAR